MTDMVTHQQLEWYSDVPRRINRIGLFGIVLMAVAFGGFGTWAFRAPLAAAVIAQGSFVATGQNKIVQHLEGGIIKTLLVSEGGTVTAGEPIVILDSTASEAKKQELTLRRVRLEAINARLLAEQQGAPRINFPSWLTDQRSDRRVAEILESQEVNFAASRQKLANEIELMEDNISALRFRVEGYEMQRSALTRQIEILQEDFNGKSELLDKGLLRRAEVNALMRALVEGEGQTARINAEIGESLTMIGKYEKQISQTRYAYRQAALDEEQSVQAELDSVTEQVFNAEDVLRRTTILAPVSGIVVRMNYHTAGGVIEPGKPIAEILPQGAALIIEALIPRTQIDNVVLGHPVTVRLTALNRRTTPVLTGEVFYISADALPATTGRGNQEREVYVARVSVPPEEMLRIEGFSPTPGMPAEILIKTQERTFLQYLTKPIVDSMSRAFRED